MRHNPAIKVDAPVYNTLIDACAEAGDVSRALETLQSMREDGVEPTSITYTSLIKACHIRGGSEMISLAEKLFAEMQQKSNHFSNYIAPTRITFQTLTQVHFTVRPTDVNTTRVWLLAEDMVSQGFLPSIKTYRSFVRAAIIENNIDKATDTINAMRSIKPNGFDFQSWTMVANLCNRANRHDLAYSLKEEIRQEMSNLRWKFL
jgi:pentatricopeptide repeat protein